MNQKFLIVKGLFGPETERMKKESQKPFKIVDSKLPLK